VDEDLDSGDAFDIWSNPWGELSFESSEVDCIANSENVSVAGFWPEIIKTVGLAMGPK
jgi:hypothetical protein